MSRFSKTNEKFEFVFGLDHVFGPFFQVYLLPEADDEPLLDCDNRGIRANLRQVRGMNRPLAKMLMETDMRFVAAREHGNPCPNLDATTINEFAKACGFENLYSEIAAAID